MKPETHKQSNDFHTNRTHSYYRVADANWCMYYADNFETIEGAIACIKKQYRTRKVGDGHDEYWNKKPLVILKTTETTEVVYLDDPNK